MTSPAGTVLGALRSRLLGADYQAALYRLARLNPAVAVQELRTRMRGYRVFWILFAYTGVACLAFCITLWVVAWEAQLNANAPVTVQSDLGRLVLSVVSHTQLSLILLILPAYSAGAISMEREKRTLDLLRATLLSASDVVTGKFLVVLALGVMLLLTSLPVAAWCLLLRGVAPSDIVYTYSYLLALSLFVIALGLCFSTLFRRSLGAIVATYGTLIGLLVAFPICLSILESVVMRGSPAGASFGRVGACIAIPLLSAAGAWLLFLALRWVWRRALGARLTRIGWLLSLGLPALLFLLASNPRGPLVTGLSKASLFWLLVSQPYFALSGVMDGVAAQLVSGALYHGTGTGVSGYQYLIWLVSTGAAGFFAVCLWAVSIRTFRRRP